METTKLCVGNKLVLRSLGGNSLEKSLLKLLPSSFCDTYCPLLTHRRNRPLLSSGKVPQNFRIIGKTNGIDIHQNLILYTSFSSHYYVWKIFFSVFKFWNVPIQLVFCVFPSDFLISSLWPNRPAYVINPKLMKT